MLVSRHLPPAGHVELERVAVVGHHHQDRPVEQLGAAQAAQDQAELAVHVAHLEQVAQVVVIGEARVMEADRAVDAGDRVPAGWAALVPGREIEPGLVRQQGVVEVEGGALALADRPDPAVQPRRAAAAGQPPQHAGTPGAGAEADPGRAHRGARLDLDHPVAVAVHEVEDAGLVTAHVGRRARPRQARVEDRRHCLEGRVVDGLAVGKPGRGPGQRGEVGKALRVDLAVRLQQRVGRELVEHHDHHRRARVRPAPARGRPRPWRSPRPPRRQRPPPAARGAGCALRRG